jgi:hypothetical protein
LAAIERGFAPRSQGEIRWRWKVNFSLSLLLAAMERQFAPAAMERLFHSIVYTGGSGKAICPPPSRRNSAAVKR